MWVLELLQDVDLEVEVLHKLLVELGLIDRLDGNERRGALESCQNLCFRLEFAKEEGKMSPNDG